METSNAVPLIIDGKDIISITSKRHKEGRYGFHGSDPDLAVQAAESAGAAFRLWSQVAPQERRRLLLRLAQILRERRNEVERIVQEEIYSPDLWARMDVEGGIGLVEEAAALTTQCAVGSIPSTQGDTYGLVFKDPLGVILGIAPWNAPIFLGLRAIVAPLAAGNTVILKGSELSPRSHHLVASLFRDAGFPPGVVNFILHRPQDAAGVFEAMISHTAVKKCNFTGSTDVGRIIASRAALVLKPVLLELGGKNFAIVLDDADLDLAAQQITLGAFLNNGQICMCTDIVLCTQPTAAALEEKILSLIESNPQVHTFISEKSKAKLETLVADAVAHGATVHSTSSPSSQAPGNTFPATVITGLTKKMQFFSIESFGPLLGIMSVESEDEMRDAVAGLGYGLSAGIFTKSHLRAITISEGLGAGAVHVNGMTVHDEHTLPHGGHGLSGWGRFGGKWGVDEFLQTRTVVLNQ
ncbi:Aldehyde/histidinol dehydrogenase [Aspergillus insuetus]